MAIAAVPAYLGKDFSQASPGMRFGMYLPLWGVDRRSGTLLWETRDYDYEVRGQDKVERRVPKENKGEATRQALKLNKTDLALMKALHGRQAELASPLEAQGVLLCLEARAVAPFTTGLGNEHPLENGFAFLNPYGLPYLPGSGVKGVLRQAARELARGEWGDAHGWNESAILALFGHEGTADGTDLQRGALSCWDVLPQLSGDALQLEIMTPHQSHYHQSGDSPHESGQPNPITFVSVPPGSGFSFRLQCNLPFLVRRAPELALENRWRALLEAALAHAFQWLGFGAKTAIGYGAMEPDTVRMAQAEKQKEARKLELIAKANQEARDREKAEMSPADRAMADVFDQRQDRNQKEHQVLLAALKAGKLDDHKGVAALRLKTLMQAAGQWKERSEKKKPEKDHTYQDTLLVMKRIGQ